MADGEPDGSAGQDLSLRAVMSPVPPRSCSDHRFPGLDWGEARLKPIGEKTMRLMLRFTIPVERGNKAVADGTMGPAIEALINQVRAEAAYFTVIDGERAGMIFFEESDQARLPEINEPLFAKLDAFIEVVPALTLEDLKRGLAGKA